jgi:tRNA threonylcarbamoyladenosine biosynthesis protein TsaE
MQFHALSERELIEGVLRKIKPHFGAGFVCALEGDLGAGKTTIVRGIAKKLGVKEKVASPTFNLRKIYPLPRDIKGAEALQHIDLYRFSSPTGFDRSEVDEWLEEKRAITFIEWPANMPQALNRADLLIRITPISETSRSVQIIKPK